MSLAAARYASGTHVAHSHRGVSQTICGRRISGTCGNTGTKGTKGTEDNGSRRIIGANGTNGTSAYRNLEPAGQRDQRANDNGMTMVWQYIMIYDMLIYDMLYFYNFITFY